MEYDIQRILLERKKQIDERIEKFVPKKLTKKSLEFTCGTQHYAYDVKSIQKSIHDPIWELLNRGGKRWRPALFLLLVEAFGKKPEKFLDFIAIPEVVHNGTLMVDDIEDDSLLRRGKPCIHRIYGVDVAINAGNAMYYLPLLSLMKSKHKFPAALIRDAYEIYVQEMINLSLGQGYDIYWHKNPKEKVSEAQYLQMCAFKTGTLARMSARLAALFAGASNRQIGLAGRFAEAIGIAFQIQDDVLNLKAGKEYGKEIGGDISEGKKTLIVIHALRNAEKSDARKLLSILESHSKDSGRIRQAISIIGRTDSIAYAEGRAREIMEKAWRDFGKTIPESKAKHKLKAFAEYLIERKL